MAAVPVPETARVSSFSVWKTVWSIERISARIVRKSGSRWPTSGVAMARRTRGCTRLGPGPSKRRVEGFRSVVIEPRRRGFRILRGTVGRSDGRRGPGGGSHPARAQQVAGEDENDGRQLADAEQAGTTEGADGMSERGDQPADGDQGDARHARRGDIVPPPEAPHRDQGSTNKGEASQDVAENDEQADRDEGKDLHVHEAERIGMAQQRRVDRRGEDQDAADDRQDGDGPGEAPRQARTGAQMQRSGAEPGGHHQGSESVVDPVGDRRPGPVEGGGRFGGDRHRPDQERPGPQQGIRPAARQPLPRNDNGERRADNEVDARKVKGHGEAQGYPSSRRRSIPRPPTLRSLYRSTRRDRFRRIKKPIDARMWDRAEEARPPAAASLFHWCLSCGVALARAMQAGLSRPRLLPA